MVRARLACLLLPTLACATTTKSSPAPAPAPGVNAPAVTAARTPAVAPTPAPTSDCGAVSALVDRRERDLLVPAVPTPSAEREFLDGDFREGAPRVWVGPPVPPSVPLYVDNAELDALRPLGDGVIATYLERTGPSCPFPSNAPCQAFVRSFDRCGRQQWSVDLRRIMSRHDVALEPGAVVSDGTTVYFNETCVTADLRPKGKCGRLVAVDPISSEVRWRTDPMVSSGPILLHDGLIVTVYQYLGRPATAALLRPDTGTIVHRQKVEGGMWDFELAEDGHLQLAAYGENHMHYVMVDWHGAKPRIVRVPGYRD